MERRGLKEIARMKYEHTFDHPLFLIASPYLGDVITSSYIGGCDQDLYGGMWREARVELLLSFSRSISLLPPLQPQADKYVCLFSGAGVDRGSGAHRAEEVEADLADSRYPPGRWNHDGTTNYSCLPMVPGAAPRILGKIREPGSGVHRC